MLEAYQHGDNAFATLTYDDDHLPVRHGLPTVFENDGLASLVMDDLSDFMKRLRDRIKPQKVRFYGVGEYGEESWRPHYHVALFGFPTCARLRTRRRFGSGAPVWKGCCAICELVGEVWGKGNVDLGVLEVDSAQYVAGYVTKKMTKRDDIRLRGRAPEGSRMSNRPGIGRDAMWEVAHSMMKFNLDEREADVPSALRHGKRELPLGRYLRMELRKMLGRDPKTPQEVVDILSAELLPLREAAKLSSDAPSIRHQIVLANKGAVARMKSRAKIFKGRKSL